MSVQGAPENNSRRVVEIDVDYYDSLGNYDSKKWDNPVLQMDSLVEMVEVHDTSMADQYKDRVVDNITAMSDEKNKTRESRRGEPDLTRESRRVATDVTRKSRRGRSEIDQLEQ